MNPSEELGFCESQQQTSNKSIQAMNQRRRASFYQRTILMSVFKQTRFPSQAQRMHLSAQLQMTPRQVQVWFQNHRQRLCVPNSQVFASKPRDNEVPSVFDTSTLDLEQTSPASLASIQPVTILPVADKSLALNFSAYPVLARIPPAASDCMFRRSVSGTPDSQPKLNLSLAFPSSFFPTCSNPHLLTSEELMLPPIQAPRFATNLTSQTTFGNCVEISTNADKLKLLANVIDKSIFSSLSASRSTSTELALTPPPTPPIVNSTSQIGVSKEFAAPPTFNSCDSAFGDDQKPVVSPACESALGDDKVPQEPHNLDLKSLGVRRNSVSIFRPWC